MVRNGSGAGDGFGTCLEAGDYRYEPIDAGPWPLRGLRRLQFMKQLLNIAPGSEPSGADAAERKIQEPAAKPDAIIPRTARLLKHSDFELVYKQGKRHFSSHMTVFYKRQTESGLPAKLKPAALVSPEEQVRVGFTVGRVLGGAVERNRIKRRLREAVRLRRASLAGASSVDVVINPKKSVRTVEFSVVLEEVARAFDVIVKRLTQKP